MNVRVQKEIARRLREIRLDLGMTQDEVAEVIEVSRPSVSMLEAGERRLSVLELVALVERFRARSEWILYGKGSRYRRGAWASS